MIILDSYFKIGPALKCFTYTTKSTVISPNFLVWEFCGNAQFPHSFHKISTPGNQVKLRYFSQCQSGYRERICNFFLFLYLYNIAYRLVYPLYYKRLEDSYWPQSKGLELIVIPVTHTNWHLIESCSDLTPGKTNVCVIWVLVNVHYYSQGRYSKGERN